MNSEQRKAFAVDIAKMYYYDHLSQDEISTITGTSRSNVSRILNKCISDGIVSISIFDPITTMPHLARKFQQEFSLSDVIIAPSGNSVDRSQRNVAERVALYLSQSLKNGKQ